MGACSRQACRQAVTHVLQLWPLKRLHAVDKSMLQQVHLEASVAVRGVMLEHLKACARHRAGLFLKGLQ